MKDTNELKYVLYARKSSESDERQAMSIDGQLMEMKEKAKREKINYSRNSNRITLCERNRTKTTIQCK